MQNLQLKTLAFAAFATLVTATPVASAAPAATSTSSSISISGLDSGNECSFLISNVGKCVSANRIWSSSESCTKAITPGGEDSGLEVAMSINCTLSDNSIVQQALGWSNNPETGNMLFRYEENNLKTASGPSGKASGQLCTCETAMSTNVCTKVVCEPFPLFGHKGALF